MAIPLWNGAKGAQVGIAFREKFGELNSFVLDSLRGIKETIQYEQGAKRKSQIQRQTEERYRKN